MKKLLLAICMVVTVSAMQAQYYAIANVNAGVNPNNINQEDTEYPFGGGLAAGWLDIIAGSQTSPVFSDVQAIPFAFEFDGSAETHYIVSSSGVLTFDTLSTTPPAYGSVSLPNASIPNKSVCITGINGSGGSDVCVTKTFGTAPNRQHWIFFSSYSATGTDWTYWSIVLEETTNNIYIVDQRTNGSVSLSIGIQVDGSTAIVPQGSPGLNSNTLNLPDRTDNSFYSFFPGAPANSYDVENVSIDLGNYYPEGDAITVEGTIINMGAETITSMTIEYSIDGGTPVSNQLTGLSIPTGYNYNYSLTNDWTPSKQLTTLFEVQNIETEVTLINSNADQDPSNNVVDKDINIHIPAVQRMPLVESFTSSTCAPCAPGNANVKAVLTPYEGQYNIVKYQMSWPGTGDPYYTSEGQTRREYYSVNSVPAIFTDSDEGVNGFNSNSYVEQDITSRIEYPSFIDIQSTANINPVKRYIVEDGILNVYEEGMEVTVNTFAAAYTDIPGGQRMFTSIVENLTTDNVKTNGETEFEAVLKKMLPNASGNALTAIANGDSVFQTETFIFPGEYRLPNNANDPIDLSTEHSVEEFDDLSAVIWIQNPTNKDVWQSETVPVTYSEDTVTNLTVEEVDGTLIYTVDGMSYEMFGDSLVPQGTNEVQSLSVALYPNPANAQFTINGISNNASITIFDAMGRMVLNTTARNNDIIDVSSLDAGVYNVVIDDNGAQAIERVSIVH